ncbi:hypothetical protein H5T55_00760 [Candidatus Bipolaricaulota bacterium]|nr:hypothetical protein [Candidatus Bipolaricaulota bacterium]
MQVLAVALAAVVGLVPVFAPLGYAQVLPSPSVVLPVGDELEEEDLLDAEGEFWHWIVAGCLGLAHAIAWTIYDAFFDGEPGFQHTRMMVGGSLLLYAGTFALGAQISTAITVLSWFR